MARGPRIHVLLLGANTFVLMVPLFAVLALRLYESYLVRQTERQLIAQSIPLAEIFREFWLAEQEKIGAPPEQPEPPAPLDPEASESFGYYSQDFRPPERTAERFIPIEPVVDVRQGILPPQSDALRPAPTGDTTERRAGRRLEQLLRRTQVFTLSAVRILDAQGCVVATTRGEEGLCMDSLPEVKRALSGRYSAVMRERVTDEPLPPLSEVRSRGSVRLFTALPIFSAGRVIGVVRASRTSLDARTSLWHNRRGLLFAVGSTALAAVLVSLIFAALIARPVRAITRSAQAIAQGAAGSAPPLPASPWTPREIQSLGEALSMMTRKLRERADYVAELAANVSHELKTPITAIRGAAELLRDQWEGMDAEQRRRFADNIDADGARMQRLVMRLLQLAQIENAPDPTERVPIGDFFTALASRYPGLTLELRDPPAHIVISVDHLRSAVSNLVENALRHGEGKPVVLRVGSERERLRIEVSDQGPGVSPANQQRLFQRFFTTERDGGGTGLGLAIVRAVAERQGGEVTFQTCSEGTTFTLLLQSYRPAP
jgi:signal transduction histidine kinase